MPAASNVAGDGLVLAGDEADGVERGAAEDEHGEEAAADDPGATRRCGHGARPPQDPSHCRTASTRRWRAVGRRQVELGEDVADVLLDGALVHDEGLGDGGVGEAFGHVAEHLALARRERGERVAPAGAGEQLGHDLGIEGGAALPHPAHGGEELADVGDAVLEQVAEPAGVAVVPALAGEQLGGVALLDVLGQDEDADGGPALADLQRGTEAVVGVRRRHADVDDGEVGLVALDGAEQLVGVGRRRRRRPRRRRAAGG